jgi:hypothetical protein
MIYKESFVPNVGKSFYDQSKTKTTVDIATEFLDLSQQNALGWGPKLPAPKFIDTIKVMPFTERYENGDPSLQETTFINTPYGIFPYTTKTTKQTQSKQPESTKPDNTEDKEEQPLTKNDLMAIMTRRKHLYMVIILLLLLILIILLLKRT